MKQRPLFLLTTLGAFFLTLLLVLARTGQTANSPLETVRSTVDQLIQIFKDPANQGPDLRAKRLEQVSAVVRPKFNRREVAKRTLGVYWQERTEQQREEFIYLFITLVEKSYGETFDKLYRKYQDQVEFFYDRETIDGNFAEVNTRIHNPALNKYFSINYRFLKGDTGWLIYDVVIENVSMIRNFRTQFYRIIGKTSYEELVQKLQAKLRQLSAAPAPS